MTPSHAGLAHHLAAAVHVHHVAHHSTGTTVSQLSTPSTTSSTSTTSTRAVTAAASTGSSSTTGTTSCSHGTSTSTSNTALTTALQTLRNDVQTIELASSTTVGQLTAIRAAYQTLEADGLSPRSRSALQSFEDSLVTTNATTPGSLTNNATLLAQFEALYTSSPTAQQTTDLTTAYNALAAAVTSANITSANITTIITDWSAVLAAQNSTSTAMFPYSSLVTGQSHGHGEGFGGC